ncbi:MAG: DUF4010 domain-containing protein, partial [Gammaproteobacteria bacterium]|nr:DUF4010 domain-containing protein [Gammaproteobacteria bacterium]
NAGVMQAFDPGLNTQIIGLGIALAIGFIIGLEREWAENKPVGVRSFALIAAFGGISALMLSETGGWPIAAGLLVLGMVLVMHLRNRQLEGITTLIAAFVVYLLGAAAVAGYWLPAIVLGGAVTVLLHWKKPLHKWVDRLGDRDFEIIVRFVLIALVILPVLPDKNFGPYEIFNPFTTWFLVVLIVGINLAGFVAFRLVGARAGGWLAGLLGGLVSSTATTISYAGMSKQQRSLGPVAALVILVASTVVYGRVLIELAVVAPDLVKTMAGPALVFATVLLGLSVIAFRGFGSESETELPEPDNPARIRQALAFAALYVVILFAVAAAREMIGDEAVYAVAFVSGLTDVDALTLSVAQLYSGGETVGFDAWRAIFLATLSNLLFKIVAASFLGSPELRKWMLGTGAIALTAGMALLLLWP